MVMSSQNFFPHFLQKYCFFKTIVIWKNIQTSFPIKKIVFIFVVKRLLFFKRDLRPRNGFLAFSQKITPFFLKILLNNRICNTSFMIKSYVTFWHKTPPFSRKLSNVTPKQFFVVSLKITLFLEKLLNKKIFSIKFPIKKVILIFGVRWLLTGRTVTKRPCCKQSNGWRGSLTSKFQNVALLTHLLRQRFVFFHIYLFN